MKTLQEIIKEMEADSKKAQMKSFEYSAKDDITMSAFFDGKRSAFFEYLPMLKLLLKDESKQPQPPDFANTMLGKVPQVVNDGTEENGRAVEGATPVVRQNEQMQKVCVCGREIKYEPFASQEWHCECGEIYKRKPADAPAPDL